MDLIFQLFKVVGMISAFISFGFVLGYLYAREQYITEIYDNSLLIKHLEWEIDKKSEGKLQQ